MISKQTLLGVSMMAFGGLLLFALAKQPSKDETAAATQASTVVDVTADAASESIARPVPVPLTADVETEARILEQKQKEREARVAQQERQARELLANAEKVRAAAMAKTAAEAEAYKEMNAKRLKVQNRPEATELAKKQIQDEVAKTGGDVAKDAVDKKTQAPKEQKEKSTAQSQTTKADADKAVKAKAEQSKKTDNQADKQDTAAKVNNGRHTVVAGDTLIRLSHQYGVPVSILAEANHMGRHDNLPRGKVLKIPNANETKKIEASLKARAQKAEKDKAEKDKVVNTTPSAEVKDSAGKKSDAKTQEKKGSAVKGSYVVQVALAADQARADQMAAQFRAAGYKVTTSQTTRGVRVMIGAEPTPEAASALKDKLKSDGSVNAGNAWVMQAK